MRKRFEAFLIRLGSLGPVLRFLAGPTPEQPLELRVAFQLAFLGVSGRGVGVELYRVLPLAFVAVGFRPLAVDRLAQFDLVVGARQRKRALAEIKRLPRSLLTLDHAPNYPVTVSEALRNLAEQVDAAQFGSAQTAAEEVEHYWGALMADVAFVDYATNPLAAQAVADLNNLSFVKSSANNQIPQFGEIRETGDEGGDFIFIHR